jgi:hypothetical protein
MEIECIIYCWKGYILRADDRQSRLSESRAAYRYVAAFALALSLSLTAAGPAMAACTGPAAPEGNIMYNQASHVYQYCSGTVWKAFAKPGPSPGGAGCTDPAADEGKLIYSGDYHTLQFCDGTDWIAAGPTGSSLGASCPVNAPAFAGDGSTDFFSGLWSNGTNIFVPNTDNKVGAYTFNGTAVTVKAKSAALTTDIEKIWGGPDTNGNGNYVYVADGGGGLYAISYDNATDSWGTPIVYDTPNTATGVWSNGTNIFVADGASGVHALTFDGAAWTLVASYDTGDYAADVVGIGSTIFVADSGSIIALPWDGTSFGTAVTSGNPDSANSIATDGTYIYVSDGYDGVRAYTFNGSAFTTKPSFWDDYEGVNSVRVVNGYIFAAAEDAAVIAKFDGANYTIQGYLPTFDGGPNMAWMDANGTYVVDGYDGLIAYAPCN